MYVNYGRLTLPPSPPQPTQAPRKLQPTPGCSLLQGRVPRISTANSTPPKTHTDTTQGLQQRWVLHNY